MNTRKRIDSRLLLILTASTLCASLAVIPKLASAQEHAQTQTTQDSNAVMYLGKVEVSGQKNIIKALQAIKVGLREPYSTDPKLADVVVCRLEDEAGSHIKQWLTCGTNRNLAANRDNLHTAMAVSAQDSNDPGSMGMCMTDCYTQVFSTFRETLNSQPRQYLHTLVNGPGLRSLLERVPYPAAQQSLTAAPPASTHRP